MGDGTTTTTAMTLEMFQEVSSRPHVEDNIICHWTDVKFYSSLFLIKRARLLSDSRSSVHIKVNVTKCPRQPLKKFSDIEYHHILPELNG